MIKGPNKKINPHFNRLALTTYIISVFKAFFISLKRVNKECSTKERTIKGTD